jgi:Flp pilus assembly protein TadD
MAGEQDPGGRRIVEASCRTTILAAGTIVLAAVAAYATSFSGSFVFLDESAIRDNPTIRSLRHIGRVLMPPAEGGLTVGGRPILNLTLAVNHAISGYAVWSYHAFNLAVHVLAGLALFGVARRTLAARSDRPTLLGWAVALLWTVHPLDTESVTYIVQRAESLMGLLYLLTLYAFIRGTRPAGGAVWLALSWLACLLGMGTKEVMASAPVVVFLYDRTFVAGTFAGAWRARRGYYLALGSTWLLLGWLVAESGGSRGGTSGFGLGVPWGDYLLTQGPAILHYLRLAVWPHPLVFYYAVQWTRGAGAWVESGIVAALFAASVYALRRFPAAGFLGFWFFAILAPTSLVPGLSQTMAEHRMYLALVPVVALAVVAADQAVHRWGGGGQPAAFAGAVAALAAGLGWMTSERNGVYRDDLTLWTDTVAKAPVNPYTQNNLGIALASAGRTREAIDHFESALRIDPDYPEAHDNLGLALADSGRLDEAVGQYRQALGLKKEYPEALANLGVALAAEGRLDEGIADFVQALRLDPNDAEARNNLAAALATSRRLPEAIEQYRQVLRLKPDSPEVHYNLANALAGMSRWEEARAEYAEAVRLRPAYPEACANLGVALAQLGRPTEAVSEYKRALELAPGDPDVLYNLSLAERALGQTAAADADFAEAARLRAGH